MTDEVSVSSIRDVAALRYLDRIDTDAVVRWATEQLMGSSGSEGLLAIACESSPADSETVSRLLNELLVSMGEPSMDERRAGWIVARFLAKRIVDGSIEPSIGARKIWWDVANRIPDLEPRMRTFVALASEWEDDPVHRDEYERDIVEAARKLLAEPISAIS